MPMRSTEPDDFQRLSQPVGVMAKEFPAGAQTGRHSHPRCQLLYATNGLMVATTDDGAWAVPTGHAFLLSPGLEHDVAMHGAVSMRTAYIAPEACQAIKSLACRVIVASPLLDAALQALATEPIDYAPDSRGARLAWLALDEIANAAPAPFALPLPRDSRLRRICAVLIDEPAQQRSIDEWAHRAGLSRRTMTRRFRAETGMSFGDWLRRVRMMHLMKRRADGGGMKEAASQVGYRSPQALRAMMRRLGATA